MNMAETISEFNPLAGYAAKLYCPSLTALVEKRDCSRDQWVMPKVYEPALTLTREKYRVTAELPSEWEYALYHEQDMLLWRGSVVREQVVQHFKGRIGERVLALVLSGFIDDLVTVCHQAGYSASKGGLIKEKREPESRPYHRKVVRIQGPYALQHDRRTTFKLLQDKSSQGERDDDTPDVCAEIDGLARLYVCSSEPEISQKYLFIAEVKTTTEESFFLNFIGFEKSGFRSLEERLFTPLRILYPEHRLVYVCMNQAQILFQPAAPYPILTPASIKVSKRLQKAGVHSLFIPLPRTVDCGALAEEFYAKLVRLRE